MIKKFLSVLAILLFFLPARTEAVNDAPPEEWMKTMTYYHEIYEYILPLKKFPEYFQKVYEGAEKDITQIYGEEASCPLGKTKADNTSEISAIENVPFSWELDEEKMREFFVELIEPKINRDRENVRIFRKEDGNIEFEGAGRLGQVLDVEQAILFTKKALVSGASRIELPIKKQKPVVTVEDAELREMGIKELVSIGESDFTGSSSARIHNIQVGSDRFNGYLIPKDQVVSFNEQLGEVDGVQGYKRELVILGNHELRKEYGGGLCQVSSTAFRGALLAGFPIVERYPHSFAVRYYAPWGTDATIYPGSKDLKFKNDTQGAILVQTTLNRENKKLQFHYYGTKDERKVKMFGSQTTGHAKTGLTATWFQVIIPDETSATVAKAGNAVSKFFSLYKPSTAWSEKKPESEKESKSESGPPVNSEEGSTI